jgi:hypothetical protein
LNAEIQTTQPGLQLELSHFEAIKVKLELSHTLFLLLEETWDPSVISTEVFLSIADSHSIPINEEVLNAVCHFILRREQALAKFKIDFRSCDINRTLDTSKFECERLIANCRFFGDELSWEMSEIPTIRFS